MRYGVALREFVDGSTDDALRALDAFGERSRIPELVPVWSRRYILDSALLRGVRERGAEPVVYLEDRDRLPVHEDVLRLFACRADDCIVRYNQEPNGDWGAPWQDWSPEVYIEECARVSAVMRSEADVRLFYCPQYRQRKRIDELGRWYPANAAQVVGFDAYSTPDKWRLSIEWCRATGLPVMVGETGWPAGEGGGAAWLRSLASVDVDAIVVMNTDAPRPDGGLDDWRWTPAMDRTFAGMTA
jgi:hypothetical protein